MNRSNRSDFQWAGIDRSLHPLLTAMANYFGTDLESRPAKEVREILDGFGADQRPPRPGGLQVSEIMVPDGEGEERKARLYCPAEHIDPLPVLIYFHGGGWVVGNLETHDRLCAALALQSGVAVLAIDYRLAPEHPFPAALADAFAAVNWMATEAPSLNLDARHIAVGGDSAGGNLAAAVALLARERGAPAIAYQLLLYPALDVDFDTGSYHENADGPLLTRSFSRWFWRHYLGDELLANPTPLAAPLRATDFSGLPPAYVLTIDHDPLRDEGEAYARKLLEAGVKVEQRRANQLFHGCLRALGISARVDAELAHAAYSLSRALQARG